MPYYAMFMYAWASFTAKAIGKYGKAIKSSNNLRTNLVKYKKSLPSNSYRISIFIFCMKCLAQSEMPPYIYGLYSCMHAH